MNLAFSLVDWEITQYITVLKLLRPTSTDDLTRHVKDRKSQDICSKCHSNYKSKGCDEEPVAQCINCIRSSDQFNIHMDMNHPTLSKRCSTFLTNLNLVKPKIEYDE